MDMARVKEGTFAGNRIKGTRVGDAEILDLPGVIDLGLVNCFADDFL